MLTPNFKCKMPLTVNRLNIIILCYTKKKLQPGKLLVLIHRHTPLSEILKCRS